MINMFILFFLVLISLPISTVSALTLETDKSKYNPSDQITVTGTGYINDYVTVQLLNSNGDLKAIAQGQCDEEGNYAIVLTTFPSAETITFKFGEYTVKATGSGSVFSKSITFEAVAAPTTTTTSETTQMTVTETATETATTTTTAILTETETDIKTVEAQAQTITQTEEVEKEVTTTKIEQETVVQVQKETVLDVSTLTETNVKIVTDVSIVTETKMITDVSTLTEVDVKTITAQGMETNQNQMTVPLIVIIGILIGFIIYRNKDTILQKIKR